MLVVQSFPKLSETFIFRKVSALLERGWDVYVVCSESEAVEWVYFLGGVHRGDAEYAEGNSQNKNHSVPSASRRLIISLRSRVHKVWPHTPHWCAGLLVPVALIHCLAKNPVGTIRYLRLGWRLVGIGVLKKLYTDRPIICLKPDVVHFEFGALAVGRMHLKELLQCRIVVSFRGYDLNFAGLESSVGWTKTPPEVDGDTKGIHRGDAGYAEGYLYYREIWEKADCLHLLGEDLWRRAQARGCPPAKHHVLIPPAIDTEQFNPGNRIHDAVAGTLARPLRILSVGRLEWKKGYEFALRAVQMLVARGISVEYRIVGAGAYFEALAFARHQMGLEKNVVFEGPLSPLVLIEKMKWADVFLHAAVSEGFCNAVMEAQSMKLPVVSSDADGLGENVADGKSGYVVPRRNPEALAGRLEHLARNPALRQRMGEAGRVRVKREFNPMSQLAAFEGVYRGVFGAIHPRDRKTTKARRREVSLSV